jgi:hypothetical protein
MLDHMADANPEKAAVLGVFLVFVIFALLFIGRLYGVSPTVLAIKALRRRRTSLAVLLGLIIRKLRLISVLRNRESVFITNVKIQGSS